MANYSSCDLIYAVREGDVEKVSMLIAIFGLSYQKDWSDGYILLREALEKNQTEIAKILLEYGSRVNTKKIHQTATPLHFAVQNKDAEIVAMLLVRGAYVNVRNKLRKTPLHLSVEKNDSKIVFQLLNYGADVNAQNYYGRTPLHCVCAKDGEEIVKLLLDFGADINARTKDQSTALHLAAEMKSDEIVKVLLEHDGVDIDAENDRGKTVLNIAIERGHLSMIKNILTVCPQLNNEKNRHLIRDYLFGPSTRGCRSLIVKVLLSHGFAVHPEDAGDRKLLHIAVGEGITKIVEDLLRYGADVDAPHVQKKGYTLLHNAADNKQLGVAEMLIKHGADVNAIDETGKSPISYAIDKVDAQMTKLLVSRGVEIKFSPDVLRRGVTRCSKEIIETMLDHDVDYDIMRKDLDGRTALWKVVTRAVEHNPRASWNEIEWSVERDLAELLLSRGAKVNAQDEGLLHIAVKNNRADMVEILLRYKADVNFATKIDTKTSLHHSAARGNEQISRMLLNAGAAINAKDKTEKTPLHYACAHDNAKIIDTLLEFGAEIDHKDSEDSTPLHIAAANTRGSDSALKIVETLLKSFADVECTDKDGKTALHVASSHDFEDVVKELLDYGADPNVTCKKGYLPIDYMKSRGFHHYNEKPAGRVFHFESHKFDYDSYDDDAECYYYSDDDEYVYYDHDLRYQDVDCYSRRTADTIKQHIVKIESLNIHDSKRNLESDELNDEFADFQAECEREVALMKSDRIGETNISYYDVLMKSMNQLAMLARNKDIVEVLESSRYEEKFPIYYRMLYYKFKRGQRREKFLDRSLESFNFIFPLPELVSFQVLDDLSNNDLENLIKAVPSTESR